MQNTTEITNTQDVIDSRDIIARIEYLESIEVDNRYHDESEELTALLELASEAEGYAPDWTYGAQLIRESYFTEYAQELSKDIGAIPKDTAWPCTCIDWESAAQELLVDYTEVDFGGVSYYIR